ncbi:Undecaprenyl-phosphate 4-deoxy-4-formamido-L-arabinose transferase [Legionella massiliensis]|uniref:Undecaprenyl-phosphate 4-deoxy-4-formamido-L-arabinose transferase n=1 Tax=Legionella massiliensis TaxID=1034943 RepID=A0A078L040_9GAMM|nr:glycosyltransferase family 2 protein [Legionella massiliensis]CDZ78491.1 Undecaprenyl-phosphate 4-deoxy-4-formamido-L-arabinose transferase [Legionella massiliensis]CEE14229.1 Undecaprenyl-phosphate 4-deoxy-4-formamido-L-arabinose transferase [Legionella massiliensis]
MIQHFFPDTHRADNPLVTLLIPALNEELTIGEFVDWCKEGLLKAGIPGQILIVDSSTDKTKDIALAHGAEVLSVPQKGLGRAYIDAIPYVQGQYIIMGDADLTYDMRFIQSFVEKFEQGYEFIMGSRFKGTIEPGAMPALHQYFGTPVTTWMLNRIYNSRFSDIHCGMRGLTLDALKRMKLQSQSWQYASEMIIKAIHLNLKQTEVPIVFHKDRDGRQSHHKRVGWYAPWLAGWVNLKAILTFGADFFLFKIGMIMTFIGFCSTALLYGGPVNVFKLGLHLHWMIFFLLVFLVGLQFFFMGILAKGLYDVELQRSEKWKKCLSLDRVIPSCILLILLGLFSMLPIVKEYINTGWILSSTINQSSYHAVGGVGLVLSGVIYFTSALLYNAIILNHSYHSDNAQ